MWSEIVAHDAAEPINEIRRVLKLEQIVPDDGSIRKVEEEHPDATTTARWRLVQAEATERLRKSPSQLGGEGGSSMLPQNRLFSEDVPSVELPRSEEKRQESASETARRAGPARATDAEDAGFGEQRRLALDE
jgi:hypothetical protein